MSMRFRLNWMNDSLSRYAQEVGSEDVWLMCLHADDPCETRVVNKRETEFWMPWIEETCERLVQMNEIERYKLRSCFSYWAQNLEKIVLAGKVEFTIENLERFNQFVKNHQKNLVIFDDFWSEEEAKKMAFCVNSFFIMSCKQDLMGGIIEDNVNRVRKNTL